MTVTLFPFRRKIRPTTCGSAFKRARHKRSLDHFVAWARYPVDLAHNFVLADSKCNGKKRDRLPAYEHLAAWTERNAKCGAQLGDVLGQHGIVGELATSNRAAHSALAGPVLRPDDLIVLAFKLDDRTDA